MTFRLISPRLYQSEPMERCKLHECRAACCLYGVWLDVQDAVDIRTNAGIILPHMPPDYPHPEEWFSGEEESDPFSISGRVIHSAVIPDPLHYGGTACIFLTGSHFCALQLAGKAAGMHPWRFKPFYCILHPLDLDENGQITLDDTNLLLEEQGSCLRLSEKLIPLLVTFEEELRYLAGDEQYELALKRFLSSNPN